MIDITSECSNVYIIHNAFSIYKTPRDLAD